MRLPYLWACCLAASGPIALLGCSAEVLIWDGSGAGAGSASGGTASANGGSTNAGGTGAGQPPACREGPGDWREEVVTDFGMQITNVVRDSAQRLHVIVDVGGLIHVGGSEGAWELEALSPSALWAHALAIGPDDSLHVGSGAYHWMYETEYTTNRSGEWLTFPVADDGGPTSIAVHPDGTPHMVHQTWPGGGYRHVVDPESPVAHELDTEPQGDVAPATAFDADGYLWLSYMAGDAIGGYELRIARLEADGTLSVHVSESHEHSAAVTSMTFDAAGRLHVVYLGEYKNAYYGRLDSTGWISELLNDEAKFPGIDYMPVMALDGDGNPGVVVTREGDHQPIYLRRIDGTWQSELIMEPVRLVEALSIDDVGAAHAFSLEIGADTDRRVFYSTNRTRCDN